MRRRPNLQSITRLPDYQITQFACAAMKRLAFAIFTGLTITMAAQPRLTLDYPAMARRIVGQLALQPGERVMSIAHPGTFAELIPYVRYEVMRAGGIDLGVIDVLAEPWPQSFEPSVLIKGAREARAH